MNDNRIQELEEWAAENGRDLPMSAQEIVELENDGHLVDLETGEIIIDGASDTFILSAAGEAVVTVWDALEAL